MNVAGNFIIFFLQRLNTTYQQLLKDNEGLQADHKNLKSQLNAAKLEQTRLEAEFSKLKEQYQQLDITSTKLTNQCEVVPTFAHTRVMIQARFRFLTGVSYFTPGTLRENLSSERC